MFSRGILNFIKLNIKLINVKRGKGKMQGNSLFETIREWFTKRGDTVSSLGKSASSSLGTVFIFIAVIAGVVFIAIAAQRLIDKKNGTSAGSEKFRVNRIAIMAMLSAVAIILNLFSFLFNGTSTAFVGEIANFIMGCAYVVPAGIIYYNKKSRKNAFIGLGIGTLISITAGSLLNAFLLLPVYAKIYGMPLEALIAMGTAKNASINGMTTFILLAVAPFNLIKYGLVSIITMLIYKPVSRLLKGH